MKMKQSRKWKLITMIGGASMVLVFGIVSVGVSHDSFATGDSTAVSTSTAVTVSTYCMMSSTEDIPHTATTPGGLYKSEIGKTTIKTTCNDANGYAIYAIGVTNDEMGRNDMLGSTNGRTIATGTATSGNTSNWAMKLTAVSGTYQPTISSDTAGSFASYHAVPSEYTKVASLAGSTDDGTMGSKVETTYATYVAGDQMADTYNGKVKYTLVHPSTESEAPCKGEYLIAYNANGGSGNMANQTACANKPATLLTSGFAAPSSTYSFAGWNTKADGTGTFYIAGQSVANLALVGETATLYAVWAPMFMQDFTTNICSQVASGVAATVYDRRDGSDYKVRYIEGACWMVQNLRITGTVSAEYSNFDRVANFDVCEGDLTAGDDYSQARCHDSGNTTDGVWYNYAAATAGEIIGGSNTNVATQDVCPAGWGLPGYDTNGGAGSVQSVTSSGAAFSPVTGGRYESGSVGSTGFGFWWSTTGGDYNGRYTLESGSGLIINNYRRTRGHYIRCVRTT